MPYRDKNADYAYRKRNQKKYTITLSRLSEKEVIDYIDSHKPNNAFIKNLIKQSMKN